MSQKITETKTVADEILDPMEIIWDKLVKLSNDSIDVAVSQQRVYDIAAEMDAALTFVRRSVEGLLEATMPPEDMDEDEPVPGGENYTLVEPTTKGSFMKYGFDPGAGCDVPASSWEAFPEEFVEPSRYDVGSAPEEDYSDLLYMTSPRDDGKEK